MNNEYIHLKRLLITKLKYPKPLFMFTVKMTTISTVSNSNNNNNNNNNKKSEEKKPQTSLPAKRPTNQLAMPTDFLKMSTSIGYVAYSKSGSYRGLKVAITSHVVGGGGGGGGYGGGYGGGLFCTTTMLCSAMLCYAMHPPPPVFPSSRHTLFKSFCV
uniref:Uncharacterized protein n=1 Tax=Glossina pallidipes TaxID=7398 RepID=A0A1A9ZPB3_GLOPL